MSAKMRPTMPLPARTGGMTARQTPPPIVGAPTVVRAGAAEYEMSDAEFKAIADELYARAGIVLREHKRNMVYGRLSRRLRELGLPSFKSYLERLAGPDGEAELNVMVNALTTNHTSFFRESHHFDHLRSVAVPAFREWSKGGKPKLRMWCSAASSGEEPYTIAMTLLGNGIDLAGWDAKVLATDLDTNMLAKCAAGTYAKEAVRTVPRELQTKFMRDLPGEDRIKIGPEPRRLLTFKQLNLIKPWPMHGPFDAIFCRNVLIYFDPPTKRDVVDRMVNLVRVGGWLYLGHSESIPGGHPQLELEGRTIYRRVK